MALMKLKKMDIYKNIFKKTKNKLNLTTGKIQSTKRPRCPNCAISMNNKPELFYRPSLKATYVKNCRNKKTSWEKVGYYCPYCKNLFRFN